MSEIKLQQRCKGCRFHGRNPGKSRLNDAPEIGVVRDGLRAIPVPLQRS